ncbi:MAG: 8-amino-7-oxononanoate synthase [Hydrogenothermaceae bacterium]|nr:8-amino-7-oxononanoate synthase [Hydrogenothermaceae bacterium]
MSNFSDFLKKSIDEIKDKGLYRQRIILSENILDFASNDYLGLKDNNYTKEKLCKNIDRLSLGSGASALISGYHHIQKELEEFLADFKQTEDCLVVGSGYMANVGLIQAIAQDGDVIFSDELNHASIIDGIKLSKAKKVIYKHCDVEDLERKIKSYNVRGRRIVITDGVFSMDGDIAPLDKIIEICNRYDAVLVVDEAHSTGVLGKEGRGTLNFFGIKPAENIIQMGTLSKAVGSYGAFICGSKLLIEYLVNKMRSVIFTTALSPIQNFISLENLKLLKDEEFRRKKLFENVEFFVKKSKQLGLNINYHGTPILTYIVGDERKVINLRNKLLEKGIFVGAVRPPTVPPGTSRLRITISSKYSFKDIETLLFML